MQLEHANRAELAAPAAAIELAHLAMGRVDLDPWSTPILNRATGAASILRRDQLSLEQVLQRPWSEEKSGLRAFLSLQGDATSCRKLLNKLRREYQLGRIGCAVVWLAHLETLCKCPWIWDQLVVIPFRRLRPQYYDEAFDRFAAVSPSNWSLLIGLPPVEPRAQWGFTNRFSQGSATIGRLIDAEPDDTWTHGWQQGSGKPWSDRD